MTSPTAHPAGEQAVPLAEQCRAEYPRPANVAPNTRIVRCTRRVGHTQPHCETDTEIEWTDPQPEPDGWDYTEPEPSTGYISCGCGFTASSDEPDWLARYLDSHTCPNAPQPTPERWWDGVFSLPTVLIVAIIAFAVVQIVVSGR